MVKQPTTSTRFVVDDGAVPTFTCKPSAYFDERSEASGSSGQPCHRGGVVVIRPSEAAPSGSERSCIVFYRPPPVFYESTTPFASTREARFAAIAELCVTEQRQQGLFNLSGLAACTLASYPEGLHPIETRLANLRGILVFLDYGAAVGSKQEVGKALPGGGVDMQCYTVIFASERMPPVDLCLAALLSSVEGLRRHAFGP